MTKYLRSQLIALAAVGFAGPAAAATVTFGSFTSNDSQQLNPTVSITETAAGMFDVSIGALPAGESGFVTGFFLGTTGDISCGSVTISAVGAGACDDDGELGGNANLNGLLPGNDYSVFDFAIGYPQQGNANRLDSSEFPTLAFSIAAAGTALSDFTAIGLRFQGVTFADGSEGSDKLFDDDPVAPVPLPAAGWMLLAGLGGLGVARRRRRRA